MEHENGVWVMRGLPWNHPKRIRNYKQLVERVEEIGFLPLFANEVEGFSVEEMTATNDWWSGDGTTDPWEWREIAARERRVAYGKFFGGKAGFISLDWLPVFANYRRDGYDFDARYEDGLASHREKLIMDYYIGEDANGDTVWKDVDILSTELKRAAGFGKGGEKNFAGIMTGLMMQLYLVTADFRRRRSKKGETYGMAVSVLLPPEKIWGYDRVTSGYKETPAASWTAICGRVEDYFPKAEDDSIIKLIGKRP